MIKNEPNSSSHKYSNFGSTTDDFYMLQGLSANTVYFVLVTAMNEHGEGYRTEVPSMIRTMAETIDNTD